MFQTNLQYLTKSMESSRFSEITVATGDNLKITGSVTVPVIIEGVSLMVPFVITINLCTRFTVSEFE